MCESQHCQLSWEPYILILIFLGTMFKNPLIDIPLILFSQIQLGIIENCRSKHFEYGDPSEGYHGTDMMYHIGQHNAFYHGKVGVNRSTEVVQNYHVQWQGIP